jgi:hypothetical protein
MIGALSLLSVLLLGAACGGDAQDHTRPDDTTALVPATSDMNVEQMRAEIERLQLELSQTLQQLEKTVVEARGGEKASVHMTYIYIDRSLRKIISIIASYLSLA